MNESYVYYGVVALALAGVLGVGMLRERGTEESVRRFAERYSLQFQPGELFKGVRMQASGRYGRWNVVIGEAVVERYTKGIAPTERGREIEAALELPEGATPDPERLQRFLQEGGGLTGRYLRVYFPKRWFSPITFEEIEQAVERLARVAESTASPGPRP